MGGLRDGGQEETRSGKIEFLISKQNYPQYASEPNKLTPTQQTQISLGPFPPPSHTRKKILDPRIDNNTLFSWAG